MTAEHDASADKLNAKLGLKGIAGQYAQLGFAGLIAVAFCFLLFWIREDAREQLRQQSIERAEDRENRKEIASMQAVSIEKLANAIGEFRIEIRTRDIEFRIRDEKLTTALDRLTEKVDKMK